MNSKRSREIRLLPLGGLGEIGMNCLAIEQDDDIVVVDCGTTFPDDDYGVDVIHPDLTWLFDRADRVCGVFLTHGHEDHIGALPYLLNEIDVPVWGPPHALELARRRLREHDLRANDVDFRTATPGSTYEVGSFEIEPIRVAHSIVEASALSIRTKVGTIVHSGDFNFDPRPPDGEPTDEARLSAIGDQGVSLLLSDSTNVDVPEPNGCEEDVGAALHRIVSQAEHRVFVTMFASNVQRLMMLGDIARRTDRSLCLLGRSLSTQSEVAMDIGRLSWTPGLVVSPEQARTMPRRSVLVLAGGTQGERSSAMARLAAETHPDLVIDPDDTVVFSSRVIPGNERPVFRMMGDILRLGARLHTRVTDSDVHTSGHATRSEQTRMIELVRPSSFMPVHGTLHHLKRHAELARDAGIDDVFVAENGTTVRFDGKKLSRGGWFGAGRVSVGYAHEPLSADLLNDRAELGRVGVVVVSLAVGRRGRLKWGPEITARGVTGVSELDLVEDVRSVCHSMKKRDVRALREDVRRVVRRRVDRASRTRPAVEVHILGAEDEE